MLIYQLIGHSALECRCALKVPLKEPIMCLDRELSFATCMAVHMYSQISDSGQMVPCKFYRG